MEELRNRVLSAFEQLENDEITVEKAGAISKLSETVVSGLRTEMQYAILTKQTPHLPFLDDKTNRIIEHEERKKLK